jgi:type IV secretory pathway VirB9-like protein
MVNYRVRGDYYVVDRLFDQAVLVAGVGRQQDRETIQYSGNAR